MRKSSLSYKEILIKGLYQKPIVNSFHNGKIFQIRNKTRKVIITVSTQHSTLTGGPNQSCKIR